MRISQRIRRFDLQVRRGKEEPEDSQSNRAGAASVMGQWAKLIRRAPYCLPLLALPLAAQLSPRTCSPGPNGEAICTQTPAPSPPAQTLPIPPSAPSPPAQTLPIPPSSPSPYPANFYAAGTVWNQTLHSITSPHLTGFFSYAKKLTETGPTYSFSTYDVTPVRGSGTGLQTSMRTGVCTALKKIWFITSLGCLDGGYAQTSASTGGAFGQTIVGVFPIGKGGLEGLGAVRRLQTSTAPTITFYEAGIGYSWPKP